MDPLTITTGIVTLMQATTAIISLCYDFRAALDDIPWSLTRLVEELKGLRNILEALDELAMGWNRESRPTHQAALETCLNPNSGPLCICLRELNALEATLKLSGLAGVTGKRRVAAIKVISWRLKDKDAKECLDRIERCKSALSLALAGDEAKMTIKLHELTSSVRETSLEIDRKLTIVANKVFQSDFDHEHEAILNWLSSCDPQENHESANSIHLKGTNSWVFNTAEFQQWYRQGDVLWISGFPGAGKTILLSRIVSKLLNQCQEDKSPEAVAYFYCDFRKKEFQCARSVVGSLISQLCSHMYLPDELALSYRDSHVGGRKQPPTWEALKNAVICFSNDRRILFLIDALDECDQRGDILGFFSRLREKKTRFGVLITSRNDVDIEDELQSVPHLQLEARRTEVDTDIKHYIDQRTETDRNLKCLAATIKGEIKTSLYERAAGMFRWAQCQLDVLSQLRTTKAIRKNLAELPKGLFQTYERILKKQNAEDTILLRKILLWVAFAALPLKIRELHEAIAVDTDMTRLEEVEESRLNNPKDIFALGGSLLTVSESGVIKLAHLSVKDYLLSTEIKNNSEVSTFAMDLMGANEELARCSFAYLSLDSLSDGPSSTQDDWERRRAQHPLINYVAKAWTYHLRAAALTPQLHHTLSEFFTAGPRFMSWIQVLNSNWIFQWDEYPRHATPLYYAASFGLKEIVEGLVRGGANVDDAGSRFGGTALHGATLREHVDIMRVLLRAGADPSKADNNLVTPLHTAVRIGNPEVLKLLLDHGASKEAADSLGETPRLGGEGGRRDWKLDGGGGTGATKWAKRSS
ncbi:hypothetical protein PG991_007094 [Apiospora marii]|uniref:NACHT domain-containing protein n=1 Tax=Apiospora marii TaxID=335849 RepID=A0ABR1RSF9_9PEZI